MPTSGGGPVGDTPAGWGELLIILSVGFWNDANDTKGRASVLATTVRLEVLPELPLHC